MSFSKAHLYDKRDQQTSLFGKAFGHPARLKILRKLSRSGPCHVKELSKEHPLSQPTMSEHMEELREVAFVSFQEVFPYTIYTLERKEIEKARDYFDELFKSILDTMPL
ncbi:MAG: helix-turn-helix transcriptional regulator [Saprospiraceae bacterium]